MSYDWEFARDERLLVARFRGRLDGEELVEAYWNTATIVQELDPTHAVMDLSDVSELEVGSETLQRLANRNSYFAPQVRRFIVAPKDLQYGLARMFQMLGESSRHQLDVVRSWREVYRLIALETIPKFERVTRRVDS